MYFLITLVIHIFWVHSEDPTGKNPGKCWVCGKDISES